MPGPHDSEAPLRATFKLRTARFPGDDEHHGVGWQPDDHQHAQDRKRRTVVGWHKSVAEESLHGKAKQARDHRARPDQQVMSNQALSRRRRETGEGPLVARPSPVDQLVDGFALLCADHVRRQNDLLACHQHRVVYRSHQPPFGNIARCCRVGSTLYELNLGLLGSRGVRSAEDDDNLDVAAPA